MKIAVLSDFHLGFDFGGKREEDSFKNAEEAINKALELNPDLFLFLGDIFHDKIPRPEIMAQAITLFSKIRASAKKVKIIRSINQDKKENFINQLVPGLIGIYGTHETRNRGNINPIHILERAGLITNLHLESIIIEIDGARLGLHGLSGVPDIYVSEILKKWSPAPFPEIPNLFMIHQSFKELLPLKDPRIASFSDLPPGFTAYLLGHIHWKVEDNHPLTKAPILIPGSTLLTQMRKIEATQKKGFFLIEIDSRKIKAEFHEISQNRNFYFIEKNVENKTPIEIINEIESEISRTLQTNTKQTNPLIRIKFKGELEKGFLPTDLDFSPLLHKFSEKALLFFDKSNILSSRISEHKLIELKTQKSSVEEIGIEILMKNLEIVSPEKSEKIKILLNFLSEGALDQAEEVIPND